MSVQYRLPARSKRSSCGSNNSASVAGPPSPLYPALPVPATVVTSFVFGSHRRIRCPPRSQTYNAPSGPNSRPKGWLMLADGAFAAGPLSADEPLPMIVSIVPDSSAARSSTAKSSPIAPPRSSRPLMAGRSK